MDQSVGMFEALRPQHCGNETIYRTVPAGRIIHSRTQSLARIQTANAGGTTCRRAGSIDYIDYKQEFYDGVLAGTTEYYSNLIDVNGGTETDPPACEHLLD